MAAEVGTWYQWSMYNGGGGEVDLVLEVREGFPKEGAIERYLPGEQGVGKSTAGRQASRRRQVELKIGLCGWRGGREEGMGQ